MCNPHLYLILCFFIRLRVFAFHDCMEAGARIRRNKNYHDQNKNLLSSVSSPSSCVGGICVGMKNGPHEGGNASYPVAWNGKQGTLVESFMTVPGLPRATDDITYYIWTDVFFGDASLGRMNQFVPQLMFGNVLDESSGPPDFRPFFHHHNDTWVFGAHYYFQTFDTKTNSTKRHAAYGPLHSTVAGETLYTKFELVPSMNKTHPKWILTMGVFQDDTRISELIVQQPYMGIGQNWDEPTTSWLEPSYQNMCINACWELYGAKDSDHLPSTGAKYITSIVQPKIDSYKFTTWEQDEGNGRCPSCKIQQDVEGRFQAVEIDINVTPEFIAEEKSLHHTSQHKLKV